MSLLLRFFYTCPGRNEESCEHLRDSTSSKGTFTSSHIQGHTVHYANNQCMPFICHEVWKREDGKREEKG